MEGPNMLWYQFIVTVLYLVA